MTHRQRFLRTMHFQPVDRVPDWEFGYWDDTLVDWHEQGLPREIDTLRKADVYFGFDPTGDIPTATGLLPEFEYKVIEQRGEQLLIQDENGTTSLRHASGRSSIPHFLDFALKGREEWELEFEPRLDSDDPRRRPDAEEWKELEARYAGRDYPLGMYIGGLYGTMRNWMGFERAAMMLHDDPGLVEEIMELLTQIVLNNIASIPPGVEVDFASGWEDMCFNKGSMISPADFDRLMVPRYHRITEALKPHGCDIAYIDCDGNINQLVSLWLKGGINGMFPVEVAAGSDPLVLREKYGRQVLLFGGVNKRALAQGKEGIRKELARIAPVVREGGWIPHVDHRVPPDVTFENYLYYLKLKRDTFGIPEPQPWEERRPADWGPPA